MYIAFALNVFSNSRCCCFQYRGQNASFSCFRFGKLLQQQCMIQRCFALSVPSHDNQIKVLPLHSACKRKPLLCQLKNDYDVIFRKFCFRRRRIQNGSLLAASSGFHILKMVEQFHPPSTSFQHPRLSTTFANGFIFTSAAARQR